QWVDVFTRNCYVEIVLDSLRFCIKEKGLNVHAWCLMSNHLHLIISAKNGNLSDVLRDFKKYTSGKITAEIETNTQESRKSWMLWIFKQAGANNSKNKYYQFWQQNNRPVQLDSTEFTLTKLEYIHNNPVKAGLVLEGENYLLSSARDYNGTQGLLLIEHLTAAYSYRKIE
ncbi:MAG: transposase, partial [Ferruginibacter sp.]